MKIKITEGAVATVQDGFLSELRKWQVGEIKVAGTQWFTATRTDGDNPAEVKRFATHAERVFAVQNAATRAGLEKLFASPDVAELLPFEDDAAPVTIVENAPEAYWRK